MEGAQVRGIMKEFAYARIVGATSGCVVGCWPEGNIWRAELALIAIIVDLSLVFTAIYLDRHQQRHFLPFPSPKPQIN
jgi:hypothetical protein